MRINFWDCLYAPYSLNGGICWHVDSLARSLTTQVVHSQCLHMEYSPIVCLLLPILQPSTPFMPHSIPEHLFEGIVIFGVLSHPWEGRVIPNDCRLFYGVLRTAGRYMNPHRLFSMQVAFVEGHGRFCVKLDCLRISLPHANQSISFTYYSVLHNHPRIRCSLSSCSAVVSFVGQPPKPILLCLNSNPSHAPFPLHFHLMLSHKS